MYKLVSVDSLAVYCDEEFRPRCRSAAAATTTGSSSSSGSSTGKKPPPPPSPHAAGGGGNQSKETEEPGERSSFLAAGLTDEDLEGMFRTSLAEGGDRHSYVVIPASPSFRLRVQRNATSGGGGGGGTARSKYKVQAFFNEVGRMRRRRRQGSLSLRACWWSTAVRTDTLARKRKPALW